MNKENTSLTDRDIELMKAIASGNTELVKELIAAGADANAIDKYGDTALMVTAIKGHTKIAKILIEAKADVKSKQSVD